MKKYNAYILSKEEFRRITGEDPKFTEFGFLYNQNDWWNNLEKELQKPVVSVRPSGRTGWDGVIVFATEGTVGEKKIALNGNLEHVQNVLCDIFVEMENDELEVFDFYEFPDLSKKEYKLLKRWMIRTCGEE